MEMNFQSLVGALHALRIINYCSLVALIKCYLMMRFISYKPLDDNVPFLGGTGPLNIEQKDNKLYWISGEIKPIIRSPLVYQGTVN